MRRRSAGEGSLYKRKDGYWVAQYGGKYGYSKNKKEAQAKLRKLITESEEEQPETITVGTYLDRWLGYAKTNLKDQSISRYRSIIERHLKPTLGETKLHELNPLAVQDLYAAKLDDGLSATTVNLIHTVLYSSLKRAVRWKLVKTNVCDAVDAPRPRKHNTKPFTPEEVKRILTAASECRIGALWVLALTTGMRSGELRALKYDQVDFDQGTIHVTRTVHNGVEYPPKTPESVRTIKLPRIALEALRRRTDVLEYRRDDWVFPNKAGKSIWSYNLIAYYWRPLLAKAGVPYRNVHTTRHTCASILLSRGVPITAVSRLLGHKNSNITLTTYAKFIPGMEDQAANGMDEALG